MSQFYTAVERVGNNIHHAYYKDGKRYYDKVPFKPYVFMEDDEGEFRSLIDKEKRLKKKKFNSIREYNEWMKDYGSVSGFEYHGIENVVDQFIQEKYPGKIEYDPTLINIASIDIEVDISDGFASPETAESEITCLTLKSSKSPKYWLFYYEEEFELVRPIGVSLKDIMAVKCSDETDMLTKFLMVWKRDYPDVVTGWNNDKFDIPYLVKRIKHTLGDGSAESLSPWGELREDKVTSFGRENTIYKIGGMSILDYMDLFKKFGVLAYGPQESYKLDHIAYVILKENKLSYTEYGGLNGLWEQNKPLYYCYNIKDVQLIQRFEDEMQLISLVFAVSYSNGCNYIDSLGTVHMWDTAISRYCMDRGLVVQKMPSRSSDSASLMGGYVSDPKPGMYEYLMSFDLSSLYPHLMMQYNMSPETFIDDKMVEGVTVDSILDGKVKNLYNDRSMAANGALFKNDEEGIIPQMVRAKYDHRKSVKKEMLKYEQVQEDVSNELIRRGVKF